MPATLTLIADLADAEGTFAACAELAACIGQPAAVTLAQALAAEARLLESLGPRAQRYRRGCANRRLRATLQGNRKPAPAGTLNRSAKAP